MDHPFHDCAIEKTEKKAKKLWKALREEKIEINFRTSPLGLMILAGAVVMVACTAKLIGKIEQKCAVKKQAKLLAKAKDAEE